MKKKILIISSVLILISICYVKIIPGKQSLQTETVKITGKYKDEETAKDILNCLEKNIESANKKDMDSYLETLNPSKREDTKEEMSTFFADYSVETELLSFTVKRQDADHILVQSQQKSINLGDNKYRNHIAEANHTFIKIDNHWYIDETIMTNTKFI